MDTAIGIKEESLDQVAICLAGVLADEYVIYTKTKKAHWNVEGLIFMQNICYLKPSLCN
jgi:starvation-inducible DNA-binding protein